MLLGNIIQLSPAFVLVAIVGSVLLVAFNRINDNTKLRRFGKRPRALQTWFPLLSFDMIYHSVKFAKKNMSYQGWKKKTDELGYTFEMTLLLRRIIFTAEPENLKALLATQFNDFGKGEVFHKLWYGFLGDSIFATDGAQWHDSRQLIRPQFVKDRVSDLHTFERHTLSLINILRKKNGETVDIQDLFFRLTLDAATDFLLGEGVDSLNTPQVAFAESFAHVQQFHNNMERLGPLHHLLPKAELRRNLKVINDFLAPYVERVVLMTPEETLEKGDHDYNFLHALSGFTHDKKVLRDQLVAVLLAARDTTAGTLSWIFYELSRRPECVKRLRKEIQETVGLEMAPTYADLKGMKYLQHVINETLRLYPAVPFNIRTALKDTTFPVGGGPDGRDPIAILKGTPVAFGPIIMHRRSDIFGADAEHWKPERWDTWTPKAWTYIPFNGGPRICIGQQFALTEIGYVVVRLLQVFEEVVYRDVKPVRMKTEITISAAEGVRVGLVVAGEGGGR